LPAAMLQRRLYVLTATILYVVVFLMLILFEVPGLGLGHFFYIPIALLALAAGTRAGLTGGILATGLYVLAVVITPRLPTRDVMTLATGIRFATYTACGTLIGWFANEHLRHVHSLKELADRDFLTGILNTRVFDEALARRCADGAPFLLLLCDLDDLKALNDAHGHTFGNAELRRLADTLTAAVRPNDELARVGGDEFAILTRGRLTDAADLCARLRAVLKDADLPVTFGWAACPDDAASPLDLFRKADDRLYAAKLIQRNHRVVEQLARATSTPGPS
jgi:diguanylate cyclase (GGDEF)-like protein